MSSRKRTKHLIWRPIRPEVGLTIAHDENDKMSKTNRGLHNRQVGFSKRTAQGIEVDSTIADPQQKKGKMTMKLIMGSIMILAMSLSLAGCNPAVIQAIADGLENGQTAGQGYPAQGYPAQGYPAQPYPPQYGSPQPPPYAGRAPDAVTLRVYYERNMYSVVVTENGCVNRVAYCVNDLLQSAAAQLPARYVVSAIAYDGPRPASIQQGFYNSELLTPKMCDIGAILSNVVSNRSVTNIRLMNLVFDRSGSC